MNILQIDTTTIQTLFSIKDLSVGGVLIFIVYYFYSDNKRLNEKIDKMQEIRTIETKDLNKAIQDIQEKALDSMNAFKNVIENNTDAINKFLSK